MTKLNINTFPYYDDFDPNKGFHRVLFKPGFAVQARELTQMQTAMQEQIRRFGNHVFKDGTVVFGCAESSNFAFPYVKVENINVLGETISDASLLAAENMTIVGENFGVRGVVKKVATGSTGESPNLKTLFIQYTATGTNNVNTTFGLGETLTVEETGQTFIVAGSSESPIGVGSLFSVGDGIVYANGNFVLHNAQTVILERYSGTPTKKVGFVLRESLVNSEEDETLLDPAQGTFNYTAPGADRYRLTTEIIAIDSDETAPEGFYILFDVEDGRIKRKYNATQYAELSKTLARRTYDESGDYTVRPFPLIIREHLDTGTNGGRYSVEQGGSSGKLVVAVESGKAYVKGYEHELFATEFLTVDKAFGVSHELTNQNQPITTGYGNYVEVNTVSGVWPVNSAATVSLIQNPSTVIGTARVRDVEFVSSGVYNIYLYDIDVTAPFANVDRITYAAGNASATVVDTSAVLQKSGQLSAVFESPYDNLKTISDASYVYRKVVPSISASGTSFNVALTGEAWAFTSALVSSNRSNDVMVVRESDGVILGITAATVSGSTLTVTLQTPLGGATNVTVLGLVRRTVTQNSKQLQTGRYVKINTSSHPAGANGPYSLGLYDVLRVDEVWSATSTGGGDVSFPADPSVDANWTNVTQNFSLDSGMRDAVYGLSAISPNTPQTDKKLIVKVSYLSHGTSSGYYTVDSYPLPLENENPTSTQIRWENIPQFVASTGKEYDLRNCIDFRPTAALTAADSVTVAGATTNPVSTITSFLSGFTHPAPSDEFIGDVTSHLPRVDRIILDAEGVFSVVRGVPSQNPTRPRQPENAMTLGFVSIAPYPSLSPQNAKLSDKPQYASRVSIVDNRRFTMRDIGEIHRRIDRLEYYTSLSLLEQNTANLLIANDAGDDRFKNGILVDSFIGHNIGNVYDPAYNCSINNGELRPFYNIENVNFSLKSLNNVVRKSGDSAIVVRQLSSASPYTIGSVVSSSSLATGVVVHIAPIAATAGFRWVRLYLRNTAGTFGANNIITQTGTNGIMTYDMLPTTIVPVSLRPDVFTQQADGHLVTLPYTHRVFAQNPYASKTRNAVSQLLFQYTGDLQLTPPSDIWTDTNRLPELQVNIGGTADNWEFMEQAWGTQWGSWEDVWQGVTATASETTSEIVGRSEIITRQTAETVTQRQERIGTGINVETRSVRTDLGNRVISANLTPFMRSTIVNFSGTRMKPNTRVYPFFDNVNVSAHCRTGSNEFGSALVVGSDGNIAGQFRIPASVFSVGTKSFTLCDNADSPRAKNSATVATANFTASGLSVVEQGAIVSTQTPEITFSRQAQTRDITDTRITGSTVSVIEPPEEIFVPAPEEETVDLWWLPLDPIAQTFFVSDNSNGMMLSKIDVFFKTKSSVSPITLQIREVINGFPAERIIPYSNVTLHPKDINVSDDASAATPFHFQSPIYLKNDTEYCFVLLPAGNDENYEMWVSELGENQIGTTQRIDKQPYAGVLFVSGNNRSWNAIQSEDMKFTMYQCDFDPEVSGTITCVNDPLDYVVVDTLTANVGDAVIFVSGAAETARGVVKYVDSVGRVMKVSTTSGVVSTGNTSVVSSLALTGTVSTSSPLTLNGVGTAFLTEVSVGDILVHNNGVIGVVDVVVSDTQITMTSTLPTTFVGATVFGSVTSVVTAMENKSVTAISPTLGYLDFNNTSASWEYKMHSVGGIDPVSYSPLNVSGTTEFNTERAIFSNSVTPETFFVRGALSTSVRNLSPVVDLQKIGSVLISNSVNNDSTNESGNMGAAISKYISRRVVLNDGQESEDLRVYLTANVPSAASVKVYARLVNDTDQTPFDERPWLEMVEEGPLNNTGFKEYTYTLPTGAGTTVAGSLTGSGYVYDTVYQGFKVFAVKIVLLSDNPASVPLVRDMRAIALLL